MAYNPSSNSVVAFQSQPSSLLVGASIIGLTPVTVTNVPSPSIIAYQLAGSIMATSATVNAGNSSVQVLGGVATLGSVVALQGGVWATSMVGGPISIQSILGTYQEKNAVTPSVFGFPPLFKIDETNSVLSAVSPQSPFPVRGSVAALQGTNPWLVALTSGSVIVTQIANSVMGVRTDNASVVAVLSNSSVTTLQGTNPWVVSNTSITAFQGGAWATSMVGGPININSILGTYQEKNAVTASVIGIPTLFKIDETNSVLSAVSPQSPFPIRGSVAALQGTNPWIINLPSPSIIAYQTAGSIMNVNVSGSVAVGLATGVSSVMLFGSTNTSITTLVSNQLQGVSSVMLFGSTNASVAVLASQGTNPWVMGSIVGTYGENTLATAGGTDKGLFVLGVRNDTMSSITNSDGDYTAWAVGPIGENIVANSPISKWIQGNTSVFSGTSVQAIAAQGASIFTYITGVQIRNDSPNNVGVTFTGGLGGVSSILGYAPAPANGGAIITLPNAWKTGANMGVSASINGVASIYVSAQGFISKI